MHTGPPSRSVHGRLAPGALCRDAATESSLLDGRFSLSALARLAANPRVLHSRGAGRVCSARVASTLEAAPRRSPGG